MSHLSFLLPLKAIQEQATGMITDAVGGAVGDIPNLLGGDALTGGDEIPSMGSPGTILPF